MAGSKIYTGQGDGGKTRLYGGRIVFKDDPRIEICGTLDELNCIVGLALTVKSADRLKKIMRSVQNDLFLISAELAAPVLKGPRAFRIKFNKQKIHELESGIDDLAKKLPLLKNFILPGGGGTSAAAWLHLARSVCRRAERRLVTLNRREKINGDILIYLNRLADLFFMMARYANRIQNKNDIIWKNLEGR
jgi:cob(I)alamin adenosyltransferase